MMHTVCLVYSHSQFYNSAARIIVLMTEVCNLLIDMARTFLDPASIFQIEVCNNLSRIYPLLVSIDTLYRIMSVVIV